ncbi:hypothetical protein XbC2_142 [Xanthomonas phage XbC2]|nr:hypothetical protein XbC2_142 [Xanthomonas phage XbC2]
MPRNSPPPGKKKSELDVKEIFDIHRHLHLLVLRKSAGKLLEYTRYFNKRKDASKHIINIKYELSKCRPEVLAILFAMARDPKRFVFRDTTEDSRMVLDDTAYEKMYFQIYNFRSGYDHNPDKDNPLPKIYINGEEFLTDHEELMMFRVVRSLDHMRQNEYKLQQELEKLEVQNHVFEIYQSEKNKAQST